MLGLWMGPPFRDTASSQCVHDGSLNSGYFYSSCIDTGCMLTSVCLCVFSGRNEPIKLRTPPTQLAGVLCVD